MFAVSPPLPVPHQCRTSAAAVPSWFRRVGFLATGQGACYWNEVGGLIPVLTGACQFGTARSGLQLGPFIQHGVHGAEFLLFSCRAAGMGNFIDSGGR